MLTAARAPLPLSVLEQVCAIDNETLHVYLRDLQGYLRITRDDEVSVFTLFHKSIADWLTTAEQAGDYFVNIRDGHERLVNIGWGQYKAGHSNMSKYFVDHLPAHLAESGRWDDLLTLAFDADLGLFSRWIGRGECDDGLACLEGLVEHLDKEQNNSVTAAGLATQIARIHSLRGNYQDAERYLDYALQRTSWLRGRRERAIALHELGSLHLYRSSSYYEHSTSAYRAALRLCKFGFPIHHDEAAANLVGLATVAQETFSFSKVIRLASRALRHARKANDAEHLIAAVRLLAFAYRSLGNYSEAGAHIAMAIKTCNSLNLPVELSRLLLLRGWLQYDQAALRHEDPHEAVHSFQEGLCVAERIHNYYCIVEAKLSLGWCALICGNVATGGNMLKQVGDLLIKDRHYGLWAGHALGLAVEKHRQGNFQDTASAYQKVVEYSNAYNLNTWTYRAMIGLGSVQWHSGKRDNATLTWNQATATAATISSARQALAQASIDICRANPDAAPR